MIDGEGWETWFPEVGSIGGGWMVGWMGLGEWDGKLGMEAYFFFVFLSCLNQMYYYLTLYVLFNRRCFLF